MASLDELLSPKTESTTITPEENNEVSTLASIFAGIGSAHMNNFVCDFNLVNTI